MQNLLSRAYARDPDVIVIDLENPRAGTSWSRFSSSAARCADHWDVCRPRRRRIDSGGPRCGRNGMTAKHQPITRPMGRLAGPCVGSSPPAAHFAAFELRDEIPTFI